MVIFIQQILILQLIRYGFPVFIAGTIDSNSSFHPTFLALASHEDTVCFAKFFEIIAEQVGRHPTHVLADGAYAITNAVTAVFPDAIRLMCWFHVTQNVKKKLNHLRANDKKQILDEIQKLQFAMNEDQFRSGKHLTLHLFIH